MKKRFLISGIICIMLTSCSTTKDDPTVFPSTTPEPSFTTAITTPKIQSTNLPSIPAFTPLPSYQNKQVVFEYYVIGAYSDFDSFLEPTSSPTYSKLVLYTDGQMIIPGKTYRQKFLTAQEINQFLSKLETLGFYSLKSNQKHDPTDNLYEYGNNYQRSYDGTESCILVNAKISRNLCVYDPDQQFLIPKMKDLLQYLDEYEPAGMTLYYPDRILLLIEIGRDTYDKNLPPKASPWPDDLPSLGISSGEIIYLDGEMARNMYALFGNKISGNVFIQNGIEYTAYINIVLPHEKITNAYQ